MPTDPSTFSTPAFPVWREQAARIVEELFPETSAGVWDQLLDLRQYLLRGDDWNAALDSFLVCREQLEADHYLPFYRLRRLLTASLRLESGVDTRIEIGPLTALLGRPLNSLAEIKRAVRRELFEHELGLPAVKSIPLRVVERA